MPLENLPYTNFHELNLDWIIEMMRIQKEMMENIISNERYALRPVVDPAAAAETNNNKLYKFTDNVIMFVDTADGWDDQPASYTKGVFLNMQYGETEYIQLFIAGAWSELPRTALFRIINHTDPLVIGTWYSLS